MTLIVNKNGGWLSNFEVYAALKKDEIESKATPRWLQSQKATTVRQQVLKYFEDESSKSHIPRLHIDQVNECLKRLQRFSFPKAELLEILNFAPTRDVEFYLLIESFGERYDQGSGEIAEIVRETLLSPEEGKYLYRELEEKAARKVAEREVREHAKAAARQEKIDEIIKLEDPSKDLKRKRPEDDDGSHLQGDSDLSKGSTHSSSRGGGRGGRGGGGGRGGRGAKRSRKE
jgi:uncharacterized membrane protein YgcG